MGFIRNIFGNSTFEVLRSHPYDIYRWVKIWRARVVSDWILAAHEFKMGNFRRAVRLYEQGLRRFARHPAANCALLDYAYCLYRSESPKEAIDALEKMPRNSSVIREALLLRSRLYAHSGNDSKALEVAKEAYRKFPNDHQSIIRFVHALIEADGSIEELLSLKSVILASKRKLDLEDRLIVQYDVALCSIELFCGNTQRAEQLLSRVLATGDAPAEAYLISGKLYLEQKRFLVAKDQLIKAMQMSPQDPKPVCLLARYYLEQDFEESGAYALQLAQTAVRLSMFSDKTCLNTVITAYRRAGNEDIAGLYLERLKTLMLSEQIANADPKAVEAPVTRLREL
jgi:tetratricopeptide (TPR) repeat protein